MSNVAIGIDLGTTFCSVGTFKGGNIDIIAFANGERALPSHVYFNPKSDEIVVGDAAKYTPKSIGHAVFDSKRFIGAKFTDKCVENGMKNWPFKVINDNGDPKVEIEYNKNICHFSPEEISSFILKEIKKSADQYLGKDINTTTKAVITVPAYFDNHQRECTMRAAEMAGLNIIKILNEPTAAAIAYSYQRLTINKSNPSKRTILIFDFGGGTFDVSIIRLDEYKKEVSVLTTGGDNNLGGEDIDNLLVDYFTKLYHEEVGDEDINMKKKISLKKECEKAKELLSNANNTEIECEFLEDADVNCGISRTEFEKITQELLNKTISIVEKTLKDSNIEKRDIDDIVCVGGSSRIPKIQDLLKKSFPGINICQDINPNEVVAYGASIVANINEFNFKIKEVVSHSLSTDIVGDKAFVMIPKNTPIPCSKTQKFGNAEDNQTHIDVNVFEGEGESIYENKFLGNFAFDELTPCKARELIISVKYSVDENGILTVSGEEKLHGQTKEIRLHLTRPA